jgi:hypothetical protein
MEGWSNQSIQYILFKNKIGRTPKNQLNNHKISKSLYHGQEIGCKTTAGGTNLIFSATAFLHV